MNPKTSFSFLEQGERNKRWHDGFLPGSGFLYNSLHLDSVGWHDDSLPGAGSLYNSVPLDSVGWHGDSPPEAGFSTSKRASPVAHQSTPQEINQGLCFDVVVILITEFGNSQSELALQPLARG